MQFRGLHIYFFVAFIALSFVAPQTRAEEGGGSPIKKMGEAAAMIAGAAATIGAQAIASKSQEKMTAQKNIDNQQTLDKLLAQASRDNERSAALEKLRMVFSENASKKQLAADLNKTRLQTQLGTQVLQMQAAMQSAQRNYDYATQGMMARYQARLALKQRMIQDLVTRLAAQTSAGAGSAAATLSIDSTAGLAAGALGGTRANTLLASAGASSAGALGFTARSVRGAVPRDLAYTPVAGGSTPRSFNRGSALTNFQQTMRGVRYDDGSTPHRSMSSSGASSRSSSPLSKHGSAGSFDAE